MSLSETAHCILPTDFLLAINYGISFLGDPFLFRPQATGHKLQAAPFLIEKHLDLMRVACSLRPEA